MVAQLIALAAVLAAILVPFAVEWFKGTKWKDEQNRIIGINAWAEQVAPPGTPPGYCHLKYVVRNGSNNDITDIAVVPPGRDKLRFVSVVHAGGKHEEVDPNLRALDPTFADYPVELLFTDSWGILWHKHRKVERVKALHSSPRTIRDYTPHHRNPNGMSSAIRQGSIIFAACIVAAMIAYGIAASKPPDSTTEKPSPEATASTKKAGS
ncbi:hypothetical protein [Streptomyces hawaiiensis]|uniref:hypothetical protein n=1 Tax=Streptomyces hawaiiensis TaxID=67305 RepID=UPI001585E7D5|nr:hypothetical protein [Streptomyces hawaiiensis]